MRRALPAARWRLILGAAALVVGLVPTQALPTLADQPLAGTTASGTGQLFASGTPTSCNYSLHLSGQLGTDGTIALDGTAQALSINGTLQVNAFNASGPFGSPTLGTGTITITLPPTTVGGNATASCGPSAVLHIAGGSYSASPSGEVGFVNLDATADPSGTASFTLAFLAPLPAPDITSPDNNSSISVDFSVTDREGIPVFIRGTALANAQVTVSGGIQDVTTTAKASGDWSVRILVYPGTHQITAFQTVAGQSSKTTAITISVVEAPPPTTAMVASPLQLTIQRGESATFNIAITSGPGPFTLSASGEPAGAVSSFNPSALSSTGSSGLTVSTSTTGPVGDYAITVTAAGLGGTTGSTTTTLHVYDYIGALTPPSETVLHGGSDPLTLTSTLITNSSATDVPEHSVSVSPPVAGTTVTLTSTTLTPNHAGASAGIVVTTSAEASLGTFTITGSTISPNGTVRSATSTLGIYDFVVAVPPDLDMLPTGSTTIPVGVTPLPGSPGDTPPIELSVSGLPTGGTGIFNPGTATGSFASDLMIGTKSMSPGNYTLTITGTDQRMPQGGFRTGTTTLNVLTDHQAISRLKATVIQLAKRGVFKHGQANSLTTTLASADRALTRGHIRSACNRLNAFNRRVSRLVTDGVLSAPDAAALTGGSLGSDAIKVDIPCPPPPTFVEQLQNSDHYLCYVAASNPPFGTTMVRYTDEFGTRTVTAGDRHRLCNPADVNSQGVRNPEAHLTCYAVHDAQGGKLPPLNIPIPIANEFGGSVLNVGSPDRLCLPASKVRLDKTPDALPSGPPGTISAYACYAVGGPALNRSAVIVDQFADLYPAHGFRLVTPRLLCSAAQIPGVPPRQPRHLLVCYELQPVEGLDVPVLTNDAFGLGHVRPQDTETLCVPSVR